MIFWTLKTADSVDLPDWVNECYRTLVPYVTEFLTSQHPYRKGKMCPFVPKAIKEDHIYFTYLNLTTTANSDKLISHCLTMFKKTWARRTVQLSSYSKKAHPLRTFSKSTFEIK